MGTEVQKQRHRKNSRRYYQRHRERCNEANERWKKENPDKVSEYKKRHKEKLLRESTSQKQCRKLREKELRRKRYLENPEKYREKARTWNKVHRDQVRRQNNAWRKDHPERVRAIAHRKLYGIEPEETLRFLRNQRGACAICGRPFKEVRMTVDHDHATKKVRGLLCSSCNAGIGLLKDSPRVLRSAIRYLVH